MAIQDTISQYTSGLFSGAGNFVTIIFIVFLFAIVGGLVGYFIVSYLKFKIKIVIKENIAGKGYVRTGTDKARLVSVGKAGELVLYLKKRKVHKGAYGIRSGPNEYTFAIGQNGFWYNISDGDLDESLLEMKMHVPSGDVRYLYEGIRKNVEKEYNKKNWIKENLGLIVGWAVILIVLIFMYLMADKYFTITRK